MKTERPILFSTPMVKSLLNNSKTMTRRIVKLRDGSNPSDEDISTHINGSFDKVMDFSKTYPQWQELKCPFGKVGDILWVKETTCCVMLEHAHVLLEGAKSNNQTVYKTDFHPDWMQYAKEKYGYKWKPSLFMPRSAARIFLEITDIRVERLQDISEQDAINEGIELCGSHGYKNYLSKIKMLCKSNPIESFKTLWQSINGIDSWELNPWCWVIELKRIEK